MSTAFVLTRKKDIDVYKAITQQYQQTVEPSCDLLPKLFTYTQETKRSWFWSKNRLRIDQTISAADLSNEHYLTPASGARQRPFFPDLKIIITEGALYVEKRENSWWRRRGRQAYKNCLDPRYILLCYLFQFLEGISRESSLPGDNLLNKINKNKLFLLEIISNSDKYFNSYTGSRFKKFLINFYHKLNQLENRIQRRYIEQSLAEQLETTNNQFSSLIYDLKRYKTLIALQHKLPENFSIDQSFCEEAFIHQFDILNQWLVKLIQTMKWEGQQALLSDDELFIALEAGLNLLRHGLNVLTESLVTPPEKNRLSEKNPKTHLIFKIFNKKPTLFSPEIPVNFVAAEAKKQLLMDSIGNLQSQLACIEASVDTLRNQDGRTQGILSGHELLISLKQHLDVFNQHGLITTQTHAHWQDKLTQTPSINPDDLLASFKLIEDTCQSVMSRKMLLEEWMNFLIKKQYILHFTRSRSPKHIKRIYENYRVFINNKNKTTNHDQDINHYLERLKSDFKHAASSSSYRCFGLLRVRDRTTEIFYQKLAEL